MKQRKIKRGPSAFSNLNKHLIIGQVSVNRNKEKKEWNEIKLNEMEVK